MPLLCAILTVLAAYLIGSIPFGYLVARSRGVNILEQGSRNIGATNVGRVLGWRSGILVFAFDFAKGALPVVLAMVVKGYFDDVMWTRGYVEVAAGGSAFLGHLFPIYLKFRGGKGVATGTGVVAVLLPLPTHAALFVWIIVVCASRYVSLASLVAVIVLCAVQLRYQPTPDWRDPRTGFCLVAGALVLIRHHANIVRLIRGTENQLKENVVMHLAGKTLHVLALGLWFGASVFFTLMALSLFNTFESVAQQEKRETWFPRPALYGEVAGGVDGPKEQGTRAAGAAVGPIFLWYFALQGVCGFITLATALGWPKLEPQNHVHRWRVNLLLLAVALVLIGWPVERHVSSLRIPRNEATEAYLQERTNQKAEEMTEARRTFGAWHLASLALNLATILCVTGAMALAASLPTHTPATDLSRNV